jgi:LPXTG-motif cell wall-anchored protein
MTGSKGAKPRTLRAAMRGALAIAVVASGFFVGSLPQRASATLTGSLFNGLDESPTGDLAAGAVAIPDPVGNIDDTNYTGSDEDEQCPQLAEGTASPKDDLDNFYVGSHANASGVFLYVAWSRVATSGTTTIDFELNHSDGPMANCNGVNPERTVGDLLITYDFHGSGPFTLDIQQREWNGTAWGAPASLPVGSFEASINDAADFGELVVNLTAAGLLGTTANGCESFATVFPKSRSSSQSFGSAIKEYVEPVTASVSNCGSVSIHKQDDTGADMQGVVFDLYTDVAGVKGVAVVPAQNCTTDADGDCTIVDIIPGTYWVVERAAPSGYTGAAAQKVTVGLSVNNPAGTLTFVNTRKPGQIDIQKNDDLGDPLQGATFGLFLDNAGVKGAAVSGKTCTTAANGQCSITNILPPGTYWVSETVVPTGYTGAADQKVTIGLDQTISLTFVNTRQPARVDIIKEDDAGAPLQGAVFSLYTDNNNAVGTAVTGKTCTTGADGKCSITGILPPGTYWVVETTTPAGHTTAASQKVTLGLNQTVELTFVNERIPGQIDITKKDDDGANLSGATFGLFLDNAGVKGAAVTGKTCTTNASGTCSITNILPPGTYWVSETVVPTGHTGAADQKVTIGLNQTLTLNFVNPRQPARVDIVKKTDTGAALAGAVFTLYTDNNNAVGTAVTGKTCTTNASGLCSITGILPPAAYWVVETTTPAGYYTADPQKVTLGLNQTVELNFIDVRKPISISIVKEADGEQRPEADPLLTESGTTVTYVLTITNEGELPLTITALTDSLNADVLDDCDQGIGSTLAVGDSFTCTYTSAPTDDAHNVASVTGTDVLSRTTSDTDEAFVVPLHPVINVEKSGPSAAHVGDVVTYTFTVTNPGDTGLDDVALDDSKCAAAPALQSKAGGDQDSTLEPGETWTYTCTYTVVDGDGNAVVNEVEVSGTDVLDTTVTDDDDYTFPVLHPAISIDKTADPVSITTSGTVTYSYLVTNIGDTTLNDVAVTDDILGAIGTIGTLQPGQSATLTRAVEVGTGSPPTNVGTASGVDVLGKKVTATDAQTITVVLGVVFELPRTGASVKRELQWAGSLLLAGLFMLYIARRRKTIGDRG